MNMIYLIVGGRANKEAETECRMRMEEVIGGNERGAEVSEAREGSSTQEVSAWTLWPEASSCPSQSGVVWILASSPHYSVWWALLFRFPRFYVRGSHMLHD